jgi:hypothetical protein
MTRLLGMLAGALVVVLAIVAFAPATLADERLASASGGRLRLSAAAGSIWQGRGVVVDTRGAARVPIEWQVDLWSLIAGPPSITLRAFDAAVPAFAVDAAAGGTLSLSAPSFVVEGERVTGDVAVNWRGARIALAPSSMLDLGSVHAALSGKGETLEGPVEARGGQLLAKGTLALSARSLRLDVDVVPAPGAPAEVRELVARLGVPDARGNVRVAIARDFR